MTSVRVEQPALLEILEQRRGRAVDFAGLACGMPSRDWHGDPSRRARPARSARRARPAGGRRAASRPFPSSRTGRASLRGSLVMSKASVASVCILNAISNDSMRASSCSSFCSFSACISLSWWTRSSCRRWRSIAGERVADVQQHFIELHARRVVDVAALVDARAGTRPGAIPACRRG